MPKTQEDYINQLRDDLQRQASEINVLKKRLSQAVQGVVPEPEHYEPNSIWCESGVNSEGKPFLIMRQGPAIFQLDIESAKALSANILECAEAAISDGFIFRWLRERIGANDQNARLLLQEFREYREARVPPPPVLDGPALPQKEKP